MRNQAASQMAVADHHNVILDLTGEHAASLLRIVALQGLQYENGNDNPKKNALAPEGVELRKWPKVKPEVNRGKQSFADGKMIPMNKGNGAQGKPKRKQNEAPTALAKEKGEANPEKSAHAEGYLGCPGKRN